MKITYLGDSRAVLCRDKKAFRLTEDHKPDRVDELARLVSLFSEFFVNLLPGLKKLVVKLFFVEIVSAFQGIWYV